MRRYVVEYDENSVAWLADVDDKRRVCLEHGMLLDADLLPDAVPDGPVLLRSEVP